RHRPGATLGSGAVPQRPPDRLWRPGRGAHPRGARGDLRRGARLVARGGPGHRPAPSPRPRGRAVTATVWHSIVAPWQEPLTQRAFVEIALVGIAGGALGCWVVLYNLSYSAESLAHGLLPGLVVAALIGAPLLLGGAVGLAVAAIGIPVAARTPAIGRDTGVAVVVTTLVGLGVLLALSAS